MQSVLKMPLVLQNGKKITINLSDPKQNVTQAQCQTFTNHLIANNVISYGGYGVVSAEPAYLYNTNEIPIL